MSAVLPHQELTMQRPHWLAALEGFEHVGVDSIRIKEVNPPAA